MNMENILATAILNAESVPPVLRDNAHHATHIKNTVIEASYLAFLDEQIRLCPRGPEWNAVLDRRLKLLTPFCNITLLDAHVMTPNTTFWIKVNPATGALVLWEEQ